MSRDKTQTTVDSCPDTTLNYDASQPQYGESPAYEVPNSVFSACLYALGYQQRLSPNADSEYASEARDVTQSIYALICISQGQHNSLKEWDTTRESREYIFDDSFYVPELFDEHLEYDTPDDMFDDVEIELAACGYLTDVPSERDSRYVTEF